MTTVPQPEHAVSRPSPRRAREAVGRDVIDKKLIDRVPSGQVMRWLTGGETAVRVPVEHGRTK
jgi:hypothetical protein